MASQDIEQHNVFFDLLVTNNHARKREIACNSNSQNWNKKIFGHYPVQYSFNLLTSIVFINRNYRYKDYDTFCDLIELKNIIKWVKNLYLIQPILGMFAIIILFWSQNSVNYMYFKMMYIQCTVTFINYRAGKLWIQTFVVPQLHTRH